MPKKSINPQNLEKRPLGRPKGVKNKVPTEIKACVLHVWHRLQGDKKRSLATIAREEPKWFYDVFGRLLLPKAVEVTGKNGEAIELTVKGNMSVKVLEDAIKRDQER